MPEYINVPLVVIIASFIIIVITSGLTNSNALTALIGGYSGLLLGILFISILNYPPTRWIDMFPIFFLITIISLLIFYLATYFNQISSGEISSYYYSFSQLSTIFLAAQVLIIVSSMFSKTEGFISKINFSDKTLATINLLGVINFLLVGIIGIVLHFYSTQG
jgi:cytochrome bd-type quinol oxidase subunit 2